MQLTPKPGSLAEGGSFSSIDGVERPRLGKSTSPDKILANNPMGEPTGSKSIEQQAMDLQQQQYNDAAPAAAAQRNANLLGTYSTALGDKDAPIKRRTASRLFRKMVAKSMGMSDTPSRGTDLQTPRIVGGKLAVSTPNLDKSGLKPVESSVDARGNAVSTKANPNAAIAARSQMSRASGGDGTTVGKVVDDGWRSKARNISDRVIAKRMENPQARANSLAGMPGVNSVSIGSGNKVAVGHSTPSTDAPAIAAGSVSAINRANTPSFQAPAPASPAPASPAVASSVPSFTPPAVGTVAVSKPATPSVPANPAADFMASSVAKATQPANPGDAAASAMFGGGAFQPVKYTSPGAIPGNTVRMAGMGPANATIPAGPARGPLIPGRTRVASQPAVKPATTLPSGRSLVATTTSSPAAQPVIARGTTSPVFSPRMPGATPRALTPRQPQVQQTAVTKPPNSFIARS